MTNGCMDGSDDEWVYGWVDEWVGFLLWVICSVRLALSGTSSVWSITAIDP